MAEFSCLLTSIPPWKFLAPLCLGRLAELRAEPTLSGHPLGRFLSFTTWGTSLFFCPLFNFSDPCSHLARQPSLDIPLEPASQNVRRLP